jgi:RNA polymerase sigma-70 factor (ECF subfamily)
MNDAAARLMKEFREGSKNAFEKIYKENYGSLFFRVQKWSNNHEVAQEITSDTFVKLWRLRDGFDTLQNVKAFLFITARNACWDYLRYQKKVAGELKDFTYTVPVIDESTLEREMIEMEVLQMLRKEMENLPAQCRKVIKMSYEEQMKNEDIARQLQIELQTVKNHKVRGLNMLRRAIEIWRRKKAGK